MVQGKESSLHREKWNEIHTSHYKKKKTKQYKNAKTIKDLEWKEDCTAFNFRLKMRIRQDVGNGLFNATPNFQMIRISTSHLTTKLCKIVAETSLCAQKPISLPSCYHTLNSQILLQFAVSLDCILTSGLWAEVIYAIPRIGPYKLSKNILPCSPLQVIGEDSADQKGSIDSGGGGWVLAGTGGRLLS